MEITLRYKATVKGYVRYSVPNGGMVVFSANLFGKGTTPPTTLVFDHAAFVLQEAGQVDPAKAVAAAEKASKALAKAQERVAKAQARISGAAREILQARQNASAPVQPWQAEILAGTVPQVEGELVAAE